LSDRQGARTLSSLSLPLRPEVYPYLVRVEKINNNLPALKITSYFCPFLIMKNVSLGQNDIVVFLVQKDIISCDELSSKMPKGKP
jgi:hypothetical protein